MSIKLALALGMGGLLGAACSIPPRTPGERDVEYAIAVELDRVRRIAAIRHRNPPRPLVFVDRTSKDPIAAVGLNPQVLTYSLEEMTRIYYRWGPSCVFGIFAHEYGHLVTKDGDQYLADYVAGCYMAFEGVPWQPLANFLVEESPGMPFRRQAIVHGFERCKAGLTKIPDSEGALP